MMKAVSSRKTKSQGLLTQNGPLLGERYRLEREIGRGGGGAVYLAWDLKEKNRPVALKVVARKGQDPFLLQSLKNEFSTLTQLSHPHLAKVFDLGMTQKEIFFSSEWVDGADVLAVSGEMNLNTVFQVLLQILRAVDYLHRRGVLHLDLKPANILVTHPNRTDEVKVVLIDFGLAHLLHEPRVSAGEFFGTPPYSAPEILMEQEPSRASDIYSLGILSHQFFAKTLPFKSTDPMAILQEQIYGTPLRVTSLHPALPEDFSDILWKMIQKDPRDRFQSPKEVLAAINRSLGENFSLRPATAPARILEESDYRFKAALFQELLENFCSSSPRDIILQGPPAVGKSRFLRGLKEALQLQGISPFCFQGSEGSEEFLRTASGWKKKVPVFLEDVELKSEAILELTAQAKRLGIPFLLAGGNALLENLPPSILPIELAPLNREELKEFLQKEIVELPLEPWLEEIAARSKGIPGTLGVLLQALREEGVLEWSDLGWRWVEGTTGDLSTLLASTQARWEERLYRIQDFLKFSKTPWNTADLAGILGLAPGALEEKLAEWVSSGQLLAEGDKAARLYRVPVGEVHHGPVELAEDWKGIEAELTRLYDHGHHHIGTHWADLLLDRFKEKVPERIRLFCARHYVADGKNETGLKALPDRPSTATYDLGLFHEIRSRAEFNLGKYSEALADLVEGKSAYQGAQDLQGLARIWNLEGSIEKKRGDYLKAEAAYRRAAEYATAAGNLYIQAMVEMNVATLYHDQGQFETAYAAYHRVADLSQKVSHPTLACRFRHNWVNLLYHMGRSQEAESVAYEWLRLAIQNRYVDQQAAALNYLALLSGQRNQQDRQLAYLNRAASVLQEGYYPQFLFQTLINRGYALWGAEHYPAAQLDAEAALEVAERSNNPTFHPWANLLLGKIHRDRKKPDLEAARIFLEKAYETILAGRRKQLLWEAHLDLGLLAKRRGDIAAAKQHLTACREVMHELMVGMPESQRQSFLRDRKMERILSELERL